MKQNFTDYSYATRGIAIVRLREEKGIRTWDQTFNPNGPEMLAMCEMVDNPETAPISPSKTAKYGRIPNGTPMYRKRTGTLYVVELIHMVHQQRMKRLHNIRERDQLIGHVDVGNALELQEAEVGAYVLWHPDTQGSINRELHEQLETLELTLQANRDAPEDWDKD